MSRIDHLPNGLNPKAAGERIPRREFVQRPGLAPEQDFDCPMCDGKLKRRFSKRYRRHFYGCVNFFETGCNGSIGCHPDGRPLGIPTNQEGKDWRKKAHEVFDLLWKEGGVTRKEAYYWMEHASGVGIAHIGEMKLDPGGAFSIL